MSEPPDTSVAGLGRTTPSSVPHGRPPTSPENSQTQALSPTTCAGRSDADPPSASSAAIEERCAVGQLPAHAEPSTNANQPARPLPIVSSSRRRCASVISSGSLGAMAQNSGPAEMQSTDSDAPTDNGSIGPEFGTSVAPTAGRMFGVSMEEGGMSARVVWSSEADDVIRGDLTAAVAYSTPAGGAVVTAVSTLGMGDRESGSLAFTTSLGLSKKLERMLRDRRVAIAYHARDHGYSRSPCFELAQGDASVELAPSKERLESIFPEAEKFLGQGIKRGFFWDRLLREYYTDRVFVDVSLIRLAEWDSLEATGAPKVVGEPLPGPPLAQSPPKGGTAPRVNVSRVARKVARLPHRVLAYIGTDGYPVIVPVHVDGHDAAGFHLTAASGLLPPGGRRAGLLTHGYHPHLIGIATQAMTGWLEVRTDGTITYAPHTAKGWSAPPLKNVLVIMNGLLAKFGYRRAVRNGVFDELQLLQERMQAGEGAGSSGAREREPVPAG